MKKLLTVLLLLVASNVHAIDLTRLEVSAAFTPPHNEPVIGNYVARYKVEGDAAIRAWRFTLDGNVKAWFLQNWRTPEVVGHGFPDAWRGSDWGFHSVRLDYNVKLGFDIVRHLQAFVEHNKWGFVTEAPAGSKPSDYYWMTGFRYKFR